ncbi:ubiquinone biosynthesis accessory factor UbiJ [Rhabdochromatium marinum]|uniref:ubiquinone biosynthesis accessory factor UbiJ n=1 Tax=Rhabdochromatium marinum TaxID=48729 RepID=UPI001903B501|nr:SCP2 sterol-binding domain-containing protein [Rhabdochromatium marinum]MBK1647066.1 sterol-binding protein [Rhabdochromatium marinum]
MTATEAESSGIPIPDAVLLSLQESVNRFLALDPEGAERLSDVQGQVLLIELEGFGTRLFVVPGHHSLGLYSIYDAEPDCTVRGTPAALLRLSLTDHREDEIFAGSVEMIGDNQVAQRIGDVFRNLDIDWEEPLARLFGDSVARHICQQARSTKAWAERGGETLTQNVREFLQEEGRLLPSDQELRQFLTGVDILRDDVERLAARIERLAPVRPAPTAGT